MDSRPLLSDEAKKKADENYRLGGRGPLKTIFVLISGPLISQLCNAIYGVVNSFWVSKGIGDEGLDVLSSLFIYDMIVYSFGNLACVSASSHISFLFGQKREKEANQLVADLIRVVWILGLIYPAIAIPTSYPLAKWLSSSEDIAKSTFHYMCISGGGSVIMFTFQLMCGILQGEGRTWLFGIMQMSALLLDMLVLLPLCIFKFHWGVWCAALSQIVSQSIPMIILVIMLIAGKMSLNLSFKMLINKFSTETWKSIKVGFASFILNLSEAFPQFATQKYILSVSENLGILTEMLPLWTIFCRLYSLATCILVAFGSAYIPPASYAYGKKLYKRVIRLSIHTFWITIVWAGTFDFILSVFPNYIIGIFTNDSKVINLGSNLLPLGFYTLPLYCIHSIIISFLQSTKRPTRATIISVLTTLVPMPTISTIIYFSTHAQNIKWIFSTYIWDDISTSLISIALAFYPFYLMLKAKDGDTIPEEGHSKYNNVEISQQTVDTLIDGRSAYET